MLEHDVSADSTAVLARTLHHLGDILFFEENEQLKDTVILDPQWVTECVSRVLDSVEPTIREQAILTREHMEELWHDIPSPLQEHFLELMEQFDLSYRIPDNRDRSLIVEHLALDEVDFNLVFAPLTHQYCEFRAEHIQRHLTPAAA